jgi:hypothetical protein
LLKAEWRTNGTVQAIAAQINKNDSTNSCRIYENCIDKIKLLGLIIKGTSYDGAQVSKRKLEDFLNETAEEENNPKVHY